MSVLGYLVPSRSFNGRVDLEVDNFGAEQTVESIADQCVRVLQAGLDRQGGPPIGGETYSSVDQYDAVLASHLRTKS